MKNRDIILVVTCIMIGFIYRIIPGTIPNFSPIAAMALVGGLYLKRRHLAFLIPFVALFASDLILNNTIARPFFPNHTGAVFFADYMIWTYLAFALTVVIGMLLFKLKSFSKIMVGGLGASVLFFLLTNFGTWLTSGLYPDNSAGLLLCFEAALPFFRNTLIGNLVFVGIFVGSLEYLINRDPQAEFAA